MVFEIFQKSDVLLLCIFMPYNFSNINAKQFFKKQMNHYAVEHASLY